MSTLHCALENVADLYVNQRKKIRQYSARSTEERRKRRRKKNAKLRFLTLCGAYLNCAIIAVLYTNSIGNQPKNTIVVFIMRDSVPSARYSSVCNVLCLWSIPLYLYNLATL